MSFSHKTKDHLLNWYKKSEIILILFFVFLLVSTLNSYRLEYFTKILIIPISVLGIISPKLSKDFKIWGLISISLTLNLYFNYFFTSNHLFIASYFSWIVTLVLLSNDNLFNSLKSASKWLLVIVMVMATIHKITSLTFIYGEFISFELLFGFREFFLIPIIWPEIDRTINENILTLLSIYQDGSLKEVNKNISSPENSFFIFSKVYTYAILAYEAILFLLLLIYPRLKNATHIILIFFIWLTYLYTNENSFFSMLCILGYLITNEHDKKFRRSYIATIIILLSMELFNLRPGLLSY